MSKRTLDQLFVAYGEEVLARQFHESYENGDGTADDLEDCICGGESSAKEHGEAHAAIVEEAEARFVERPTANNGDIARMRDRASTLYHLQHSPLVSGLAEHVMTLADMALTARETAARKEVSYAFLLSDLVQLHDGYERGEVDGSDVDAAWERARAALLGGAR